MSTILSWSGSDSSYDLIVQVVQPRPSEGVVVESLGMESNPRLEAMSERARSFGRSLLGEHDFGLRCLIAQRVPEDFVWKARIRAAIDKVLDPALDPGSGVAER